MKNLFIFFIVNLILGSVLGFETGKENPSISKLAKGRGDLAIQKVGFEENKGQVRGVDGAKVTYTFESGGLSIFLMQTGFAYQFNKYHFPEGYEDYDNLNSPEELQEREALADKIQLETYRMNVEFIGANPNAKITAHGKSLDYVHYYSHDALDVHTFNKITYHEIYPQIDWVIYQNEGAVKYDFVIHPGGDPDLIKLQITHAEDMKIDQDGQFVLTTAMGTITEKKPVSFQGEDEIRSEFLLSDNVLAFKIGSYDTMEDLIIDPVVGWGTYYGGGNSDVVYSSVVDSSDNVYVVGSSSSANIAVGGHQITFGGAFDALIVKFNASGARLWSTYYGGNQTDVAYSCSVDDSNNLFFVGSTYSLSGIAHNGYQNVYGGSEDAFLVKMNASGTRMWSTYYGGSSLDWGWGCATDLTGNVYLTGYTIGSAGLGLNGHQNTYAGGSSDGIIAKFSSSGTRLWATYYGGSAEDYGTSCVVDTANNVFMAGRTSSTQGISMGGHQNTIGGINDAFLVKFDSSGTRLWATYYGGSGIEKSNPLCAVDPFNNLYLSGTTKSATGIASNGFQNTYSGGSLYGDAFLVKFNTSGTRLWATYYGGSLEEYGPCPAVDDSGFVYMAGGTQSTSGIAWGGYQNTKSGQEEAFLVKFDSSGTRMWGTYYGGPSHDRAKSCTLDSEGNVYFSGGTWSHTGISLNGFQNSHSWGFQNDFFLVKMLCTDSVIDVQTACIAFTWINGVTYTSNNNSATYTLINSSGCDSVVTLNLVIYQPTYSTDVQYACNSFTWMDGITYTSSNDTATYILTNVHGCDSIITLDLEIFYPNTGYDVQIACDSYTSLSGKTWTTSGIFLDTLTNSAGCDSVVTLDLTINHSSSFTDVHLVCDSLVWIDGVTYTQSNNTATHTLVNSVGCDSVVTLNLSVNSNASDDVIFACNSYTWSNGITYTTSNNSDTLVFTNTAGCDSIVTLDLTIGNSNTGTDVLFACDSLTWIDGVTYYSNINNATYTVTNSSGCDSVVTLDLTIGHNNWGVDTQVACNSYTSISGKTWTTSGTYLDTLTNQSGCDSIVTLNLTINYSKPYTEVLTACDSLTWIDGVTYTSSNYTATHLLSTVDGCDSLVTLNLTINSNTGIDTQTACDSFTWIDGNTYFTSNNTATDTLTNAFGCDSIVTLNLTVYPIEYSVETLTACDSLTWINGITYYSSINTVSDTLINRFGCDSIVSLDLTIHNSSAVIDSVSSCLFYQWINGQIYISDNNTATQNFVGVNGCDSIVTLNLEIHAGTFSTDTHVVCDSLVWIDGNTYFSNNTTAQYTIVGGNSNGCDSLVSLDLTVNGTSEVNVITACESYTWIDGVTYTSSNDTATFTTLNALGCDSTVYLDLTINNSSSSTDVVSACGSYTWIDGINYTSSNNTATVTFLNSAGCDSIVTLNLTLLNSTIHTDVINSCTPITWIDGNLYSQTTNGPVFTLVNSQGCDSLVTLDFTLIEVDTSVIQNNNSFVAQAANATFQWINCQKGVIQDETDADFVATENGSYQVEVSQNGCIDSSACFVITNIGIQEADLIGVSLYPNPTSDVLHIDKGGNEELEITITNSAGTIVFNTITQDQITTLNMAKMAAGVYVVTMQNEHGFKLEKIVKK